MSYHRLLAFVAIGSLVFTACAGPRHSSENMMDPSELPDPQTKVVELAKLPDLDWLLDRIQDRRVIFVGESHDRYEDHLNQLAIIAGLHARGKSLAIGMEFFQQPFQGAIDEYLAGKISEADFLRRTQYFDRWRFDYRLYRPILQFAREQGIPVIALNLESELTRRVGEVGIAGLNAEEKARVPAEIDRGDQTYRERLEAVFAMHPSERKQDIEHFIEVQLLWDEGMAERAARYLEANPGRTLVVLAGSGHIEYGQGIPKRLIRRTGASSATILNGTQRPLDPAAADFFIYPREVSLPKSGLLGVVLESGTAGDGVRVQGFGESSGAKDAGMKEGDRIVRIGDQTVTAYADVRIALVDSQPGQRIPVEVMRARKLGSDERLSLEVELR